MRCALMLALAFAVGQVVWGEVTVKVEGQNIVMENERLKLVIVPSAGGRIASLVNKQTGKDMVALWKGATEIGGALDDRLFFTSMPYEAAIMHPSGEVGVLRLEAKHPSQLAIVKTISLRQGEDIVRVSYEFRNGTQQPYRLWVRNFFVPGGAPLTNQHRYFLPCREKPIVGQPFASEYFADLHLPYAALLNTATHEGLLAVVPGVEQFYFWQGSQEFPTFEWLYPSVPAGKIMTASLALVITNEEAPDWDKLTKLVMATLQPPRFSDVPGWVDETTKFGVTEAERKRGFWLSIGRENGKQRLPETLELDLPLDEERAVYIGINALKDFTNAILEVEVSEPLKGLVQVGWEVSGENFIAVEPLKNQLTVNLSSGVEHRFWLLVNSHAKKAGVYSGQVKVQIGEQKFTVPIKVRIWNVRVPKGYRPFSVRGYGTISDFAGGYEITPESLKRMDTLFKAYAAIGGNVLDWTVYWAPVLAKVKIAGTNETLTEVAMNQSEKLTLDNLPSLDFSYFDPWLELAKKHGITRVETYLDFMESSDWQWRLLDPAVGKGRVKFGTEEAERVIEWVLRELKRYFQRHGLTGFFCKIGDEISPEHIPSYIRCAKVSSRAGWRPFTTITGMIARTAEHINTMNPHCDQWQVAIVLKDDFRRLLSERYRLEWKEVELKANWGAYTNGGAENTWVVRLFGGLIPEKREDVERVIVLEDGKPLQERGGSPWGNKERGVYFSLSDWLYISPTDGSDPNEGKHRYFARYGVRVPDAKGKPLAEIDKSDEVWFYGGSSHPYRVPYEVAAVYPLLAAIEGVQGYGWWAFQWWQQSEKIVWFDGNEFRFGPTFLGLRDGFLDARLLHWAIKGLKAVKMESISSEKPDALLRIGEVSSEVYRWKTIVNLNSPIVMNRVRRMLLEAVTKR